MMIEEERRGLENKIREIQLKTGNDTCVYYCLIGNYDDLHSLSIVFEDHVDYFLITNQNIDFPGFYNLKISNKLHSDRRTNRWFKLRPELFFASYEKSLYLDANLSIVNSIQPLFMLLNENPFVIFEHNKRSCVYKEISECKRWKRDSAVVLNKQKKSLKNLGIPLSSGLYLGSVLIRKHNEISIFSEKWWFNYANGSSRDQISLVQSVFELQMRLHVIPYDSFSLFFKKIDHSSTDISEKNLTALEKLNLKFLQLIYRIYTCLIKG